MFCVGTAGVPNLWYIWPHNIRHRDRHRVSIKDADVQINAVSLPNPTYNQLVSRKSLISIESLLTEVLLYILEPVVFSNTGTLWFGNCRCSYRKYRVYIYIYYLLYYNIFVICYLIISVISLGTKKTTIFITRIRRDPVFAELYGNYRWYRVDAGE